MTREEQIEKFMKEHPDKVTRLPPANHAQETVERDEQFDRVQLGQTWGAYRRKKHRGSDTQ